MVDKLQPAAVPPVKKNTMWQANLGRQFATGKLTRVPWHAADWYAASPLAKIHCAHVDPADASMVRFVDGPVNGERGVFATMRPGRYLARFFPGLPSAQVKALTEEYNEKNAVSELKIAMTPEEIEHVYIHGPNSCMSGDSWEKRGERHPHHVWGAGDIGVAYIEDDKGHITGRVMCRPENKVFGRIYGDCSRLAGVLAKQGWRRAEQKDWHGCKMLRVVNMKESAYVLGAFDEGGRMRDDGEYLVIDPKGDLGTYFTGLCHVRGLADKERERIAAREAAAVDQEVA